MLVVLFLGATQLMTLGIFGEYIGRIYDQTRGRPRYLALEESLPARPRCSPVLPNHRAETTGVRTPAPHELPEVAR